MTVRIDDFKSALIGGGARPNLFRVTPSWPAAADATFANNESARLGSFMIKTAQLPNSTVGEIPVFFRGRQIKVAGDRTFDDWTITIINDNNFSVRDGFEAWSSLINTHVGNEGQANIDSYLADWTIEHLDKAGNTVKSYKMVGCWPTAIDPIDVSYDSTDTIEEFTATIAYQWWTARTTDQ